MYFLRLVFNVLGRISPRFTGKLVYWMMFRPKRYRLNEDERQVLSTADACRPLIHNGRRVVTYQWGAHPVVLLVHGWDGCAGQFYVFIKQLTAAGFGVVAFDFPAHGQSEGRETDLTEYVAVMHQLCARYGRFTAVVAHSFGGLCATYALKEGFQASCAVVISTPSRFVDLSYKIQPVLGVSDKVMHELTQRVEQRFASYQDFWDQFSADTNAQQIKLPAMIIHDSKDKEVPLCKGQSVAKSWADASLVVTTGLGHRRIIRDEEVVNMTVHFIRDTVRNL